MGVTDSGGSEVRGSWVGPSLLGVMGAVAWAARWGSPASPGSGPGDSQLSNKTLGDTVRRRGQWADSVSPSLPSALFWHLGGA